MNFCPNCGERQQNPSAQFCANCGFAFGAAASTAQPPADLPAAAETPKPRPQLFDYEAPPADDTPDAPVQAPEKRQPPQFFDLDAPFEAEVPAAASPAPQEPAPGNSLFLDAQTQEISFPAEPEPAMPPFGQPEDDLPPPPAFATQPDDTTPDAALFAQSDPPRAQQANSGFSDLLTSVNNRARPTQPQPDTADPLRTPWRAGTEAAIRPPESEREALFPQGGASAAQPEPAHHDFFQSAPSAGLFQEPAPASTAQDGFGGVQSGFTQREDPQQDLFAMSSSGAADLFAQETPQHGRDLFADAQRAPASLDETQVFGGKPRSAPPAPRQQAPHREPPPRQQAYAPPTHQEPQPADAPGQERARRAAMVASISQAAAENTSSIPYDTDPYAPTPRVQQRQRQQVSAQRRAPVRAVQQIDDYDDSEPRRSAGSIVGTIILFVLIFAICTAIATLVLLYWPNRPAAAINAYTEAITDKNYDELSQIVTLNNATPTAAGWEAMCAEFETEANMDELKSELAKINVSASNDSLRYPSIRLVGDDLFLFIKKYHVEVTGVEALASGAAEGTILRLNGEDHTGAPADGGILYQGILPGKYSCMLLAPGQVEAAATEQSLFAVTAPNVLGEGAAPGSTTPSGTVQTANLTIENCMNDEATLYLNDMILPDKPSGGVAHLTAVPAGAVIRITAEKDGKVYESSVTFSDAATTTLRFETYTEVDVPSNDPTEFAKDATPDEINAVLATFYSSYLNSINNQNTDGMQASTDRNTQALVSRITNADNAANTYKFISATCKPESITAGEQDGKPMLTFNGAFAFNFTPRDGSAAETGASNHQSVRMIYDNGQWKVDGFTFVSEGDYNNNIIAAM